jgi:fatty acid desaturase
MLPLQGSSASSAATPCGDRFHAPLPLVALLLTLITTATGCAAVGGIFRAGLWVGLILALLVGALVFFVLRTIGYR